MSRTAALKLAAIILAPLSVLLWVSAIVGRTVPQGAAERAVVSQKVELEFLDTIVARPGSEIQDDTAGRDEGKRTPSTTTDTKAVTLHHVEGTWQFAFERQNWLQDDLIATETVLGEIEVPAGQDPTNMTVRFQPSLFEIDGTPNDAVLPSTPNLLSAYFEDQVLYILIDQDDFFMDPELETPNSIEPEYVPFPMEMSSSGLAGRAERVNEIEIGGAMVTTVSTFDMTK